MTRYIRLATGSLQYILLGLAAFISVFPFIWMVISATNTTADIIIGKVSFGHALLTNIQTFMTQVDVPLIMWNSIKIAGVGTVLTLAVTSLAG